MKTCPQCRRSYPDAQLACTACSLRLPQGEQADTQTMGHINYLLGELPQWVMNGWIDPKQAQHIGDRYRRRRDELFAGGQRPAAFPDNRLPPLPSLDAPTPVLPPVPAAAPVGAFRDDRSLSYWLLIGALLLLAGLMALVRWTWWGPGGKMLVVALMLGLTGGLGALARSRVARQERFTATVLTAIAALLIPLDLFAANAFLLFGSQLTPEGIGLLSAVVCLPLYGWLARRDTGRTFLILLVIDFSAAVHFLLQSALPPLLHGTSQLRLYSLYGPVYVALATVYLGASRKALPANRPVWRGVMHATVATALAVSLAAGILTTLGPAAVALLMAGALYTAASIQLRQAASATMGVTLASLGIILCPAAAHLEVGTHWYAYVLAMLASAFAFRALSTCVQEPAIVQPLARRASTVAGIATVAQTIWVVPSLGHFPAFPFGNTELCGALACAAMSAVFFTWARVTVLGDGAFTWARTNPLGDTLLAYSIVLVGLLASHNLPNAAPGNIGLWLALAAALLKAARHRTSALFCGWIALAICGAYALHGGFLGTGSVALLLLVALFARGLWASSDPKAAWLTLACATLLVLLWESHGLPHLGIEQNNGYGLVLLSVACLGLYARRRDVTLRQGAAALGLGSIALQFVYAADGAFPYSPLLLLAVGITITSVIAYERRSEWAAVWATTLVVCLYLTYLAGLMAPGPAHPTRETLLTVTLVLSAVGLGMIAERQRRLFLGYAATVVGTLGWAHGVHRVFHPAAVTYALALLPLVAAYQVAAIFRARQDDLWQEALQNVGLNVSALALLPCLGAFVPSWPPADAQTIIATLVLYGALYAAVAWLQRSAVTLYAAALLLNGAYLFHLLHYAPALTLALAALGMALAGLLWLGAGIWQRLLRARDWASLFPIAAGVALAAAGLALADMHGDDALYALLIAGTTYVGITWGTGRSNWAHLGVGTYLLAYVVWLWDRIGTPSVTNSDVFLIPIGLYALALGLLARRGLLDASAPPFHLAGLLLILTPTYLAARQPSAGLLHALLLAGECLAFIFYGLAARLRVFFVTGTLFLLLWVQLTLRGVSNGMSWAVSAILLGLAILGSALYLEKRRDRKVG